MDTKDNINNIMPEEAVARRAYIKDISYFPFLIKQKSQKNTKKEKNGRKMYIRNRQSSRSFVY